MEGSLDLSRPHWAKGRDQTPTSIFPTLYHTCPLNSVTI
jgi:hypothetical protein